ncbi:MAG: hypothetical protein ACK52W_00695, partial [Alphaproteobacteria bacterium]
GLVGLAYPPTAMSALAAETSPGNALASMAAPPIIAAAREKPARRLVTFGLALGLIIPILDSGFAAIGFKIQKLAIEHVTTG